MGVIFSKIVVPMGMVASFLAIVSNSRHAVLRLTQAYQLVLAYAIYNAFVHPLRRYPGPLLWRSFRFPYVISTQRGELHKHLKDFHTRYGPIVRCAPNELSYADAAAWKDIYASRPGHLPFQRNQSWFKKMRPDEVRLVEAILAKSFT